MVTNLNLFGKREIQIPTGGAAHFTFKLDFVYDVIVQLTHRANERARRASDMSDVTD